MPEDFCEKMDLIYQIEKYVFARFLQLIAGPIIYC
jgi:hypothetical protein